MSAKRFVFAALWFALLSPAVRADNPPPVTALTSRDPALRLLPQPAKLEVRAGEFRLDSRTAVVAPAALVDEARTLASELRTATGFSIPVQENVEANSIRLTLDSKLARLAPEGYQMKASEDGVEIAAPTTAGIFYGGRTLLQLAAPVGGKDHAAIAGVTIEDQPRFGWRGLMLDCSRTFQSPSYVRQTLDRMAVYKLNVLHLHLTDDQGWRLEIRKHPELTQKAAFFSPKYSEPPSHQGFYTQAQMREIVAYAAARHITVVPEIEMPGHSHEVFVCRPELCCTGKTTGEIFPFFKGPTTTADVFCAGNEKSFQFLQEVLDEVVEVFPSRFVHVGGDEVPKTAWKSCPKCQARMKAEGLKDEHELQSYFIRRMEKHLASKGRRMIGWDEIIEGGLAPNAAVMSWRGSSGGVAAAKAGHDAVMSPTSHCYFDYSYGEINSERAFSFDPLAGIAPEAARHMLGVQANFWSHIDREPELVDRQLFPRLLALAERGWSPDNRGDWPAYARRARAQLPRLERLGIHYQTTDLLEPTGEWSPAKLSGEKSVLEFDVTASLTKAGRYEVKPVYRRGAHGLFIHSVELLRGSEVVAGDQHEGFAGAQPKNDTYILRLPAAPAGAAHRLRLTVSPGGGTNSWGQVFLTGPSPAN